MSDGSTGAVAVTYTATGGTVSTGGLYKAGTTAGTYRVIAVQQGGTKADTSAITVTATDDRRRPRPGAGRGGPECVAGGERAVEERDGVHGAQRAGDGGGRARYTDPVTGVRVWKVTSASVPDREPGACHYLLGRAGAGERGVGRAGKHTLLV